MPVKAPVTSLAGSIDSTFISEGVKQYTELLAQKKIPKFEDLANMEPPEGFVTHEPKYWYKPWAPVDLTSPGTPAEEKNDPVIKMAGAIETTPVTKGGQAPKQSLLGYNWSPALDRISTDKSEGLNLHPARRGLRPEWACLRSPEDLLRLHAEKPLRHRHALAAAHSTYDPLTACPWVAVLNKFCYRVLVLNTELNTELKRKNNKEKYDELLTTDYITNHMFYMVEANLENQVTFAQPRSWRLPMSISYESIDFEVDALSDGCWGALGAGATLCYLLQRYEWEGEKRVKIYLYSGNSGLNPLLRPHHQLTAELTGVALAQKEVEKAMHNLKSFLGSKLPKPRLICDSQTALTLMTKPAVSLTLGTGLLASRVQDTFGYAGLYYAPGEVFSQSIDLLTRYNPQIGRKITSEFYSPSFLRPTVDQRCTTHVSKMKLISDDKLPHRNPIILKYATIPGSQSANVFAATPEEQRKKNKMQVSHINSTGKGAMKQEILCEAACGTCNTAKEEHYHPKDTAILKEAREKEQTKTSLKTSSKTKAAQATATRAVNPTPVPVMDLPVTGEPAPWELDSPVTGEPAKGESETVLSAAAITGFKGGGSRARRATRGARSGLKDNRAQKPDTNVWKELLEKRQGYLFAVRVLTRILDWRRRHQKQNTDDSTETTEQRAILELFRAERENAFEAASKRRAGGSSSSFQVVEHRGIVMLQGRKYDPGTDNNPSVIRQSSFEVVPEVQRAAYSVPLLSPTTALGTSTAQEVHNMAHSESPASTNARGSRWFYWLPSAMPYLTRLREDCYTCRKLIQKTGKDIISPLRSIGQTDLQEGKNLMIDTFGPMTVFCKPRMALTREANRTRRDTIKLYVLLSVCMYSHRVSAAVLDSMTTDSIMSGLKVIMMEHGYMTKELSFDAGSSLIPAAERTAEAVKADDDEEEEREEDTEEHELDPTTAAAVVRDLKRAGFKLRQTYSKASYKQSNVESSVKSVKKILKASFLPGMAGMTVTSFTRVIQLAISTVNLRPVILLPYDSANPGELTVISPQALRGPDHAQYVSLAKAHHYTGQAAIVAQQQLSFAKKWKIFYTARLRKTHSMAQDGIEGGDFKEGDVCLIMDLSSSHNQNPFPQLGIITGFRGPGQAELRYGFKDGRFKTVNRPLSKLSKLVSAHDQIPPTGLLFDPLIMDDYLQAEETEELDDNKEDVDNDREEHTNHQDDGVGENGGEDRTRDAGDQYDAGPKQQQEQREAAVAVLGESNSLGRPAGAGPREAAAAVLDESTSQEGQEERFERGAPRATDVLGAAGSDQTQGQHGQRGQHGQHGQHEVTVLGTNQSVQRDAVSEPLTGRRKRVRTTHFWNR